MRACALLIAAAVVVGCGSGDDAKQSSSDAAHPTIASATRPEPKFDPDARIKRQIRRYVANNFGIEGMETTWFGAIKGYRVNGGDVTVMTDVYPDADAEPIARSICASLVGAALPEDDPTVEGITGARVLDGGGGLILRCKSPAF